MPRQSITITGIDGFVGRHLAREAKREGLFVRGVSRAPSIAPALEGVVDEYISADLRSVFPENAISDSIVHLAGLAAVGRSFTEPQHYIEANSSMVTNICETLLGKGSAGSTRLLAVSTGAVYAASVHGEEIDEQHAINFSSPYVVSKILVENQIEYYRSRGIEAVVARPFNHIGPGQGLGFIVPDLWSRLSNLNSGEPLHVGNLQSSRDYLDVRDVAHAYLGLATFKGPISGTLNVCSGITTSGIEILELLCDVGQIELPAIQVDAALNRPNDASRIVGSSLRLRSLLGWEPRISLRRSIRDFLEACGPQFSAKSI